MGKVQESCAVFFYHHSRIQKTSCQARSNSKQKMRAAPKRPIGTRQLFLQWTAPAGTPTHTHAPAAREILIISTRPQKHRAGASWVENLEKFHVASRVEALSSPATGRLQVLVGAHRDESLHGASLLMTTRICKIAQQQSQNQTKGDEKGEKGQRIRR